jgi:hypothetical protein
MDWEAFARRVEEVHDPDAMVASYAAEATYRDPITPVTTDVRAVAEQTYRVFPDWSQRVERIRGGDNWAVFEWVGSGTYQGPGAEDGPGFPVRIEGATIVEVNDDGLITALRDFPDVHASMQQITARLSAAGGTSHQEDAIFADWDAHIGKNRHSDG